MNDDVLAQARAAVATGDRAAALRLLARMAAESSVFEGVELSGLLGDALVATAVAQPTADDAAVIEAYRRATDALTQILHLIADAGLDSEAIAAVRTALARREASLIQHGRHETLAVSDGTQSRRVGRGWVEAKVIRGHGPYWYWRYRDGQIQRSKYLGKAPPDPPK